jgi:hypothetical protein
LKPLVEIFFKNNLMNIRLLTLLLLLLTAKKSLSQDLPEIVPLSPNAASIVKYGEIPVGHFTGVPNIEIPIYTVSSGELNLPLHLSYHAGGNKVESTASWVGLGWSLGSIPSISRNIMGIADENGGYFSKFSNKTVQELWNLGGGNTFESFRVALFDGTADSEPDIFHYSLPGESGKFFYNQESDVFITFPKSNIKIVRNGNIFKLVTQDGIEYVFNILETSTSHGYVQGSPINSTWYASTMSSASKKYNIRFTYQMENQIQRTKNVTTKYHYLAGLSNGFPSDNGSILSINSTNAMVLDSIIFNNGYVKFNRNMGVYRDDLNGGHSLNNISVYNNHNQLINKNEFTYRFKQGNGSSPAGSACYNANSYSRTWMLLDKMDQVSTSNPNRKLSHSFNYDEGYFPACRYSAAQDYWGYYNGNDSNSDLTPPYYLPNSSTQLAGADRGVNPSKSKFGNLTKITYPTGGYTEFDFENNTSYADDLPPQYVTENQMMAGDEYFDWEETLNETDSFQKTFTINNLPDLVLNNNNQNGGANVSFQFFNPGCDLSSGQANMCARFTVSGRSINTTDITIYGATFYLHNGTYTMTASFDQPYPNSNYQDFIFIAEWQKIDPNQTENTYSGGLRIKETRSYPDASSQPLTRRYKYTKAYDSTESSGDIFSIPNFSHTEIINYHNATLPQSGVTSSTLLRVRSLSNTLQVTQSGSFVGYNKVFEETHNANETGYKEYGFSNARDEPQDYGFPYPPDESFQLERGQLMLQKDYKKEGTIFKLVQEKDISHTSLAYDNANQNPKSSFAIKWGNLNISDSNPSIHSAQTMTPYYVFGGWNNISDESITNYYDNETNSISTSYYYDNPSHLLKTSSKIKGSDNKLIISNTKYPKDLINPSSAESGLITQNRLGEVIETNNYKDLDEDGIADSEELVSTQRTNFYEWGTNLFAPENIQTSKGTGSLKDRVQFHGYYDNGNVKEVSRADGVHIVYIWGYNETLPIAKIENAIYSQVSSQLTNLQYLSNLDDDSCYDSDACDEKNLRTALASLRNSLPQAMVTTYTYDPLIGVTSITDPKDYTVYYEYDDFNRLKQVKDADGKILSENEYNYKQ